MTARVPSPQGSSTVRLLHEWLPVSFLKLGVEIAVATAVFCVVVWLIAQGNLWLLRMEQEGALPDVFVTVLQIVKYVAFFIDVGLYLLALLTSALKFVNEQMMVWSRNWPSLRKNKRRR